MNDKDTKMLFEAYSKVYIKESYGKHIEVGYTTKPLPEPIILDIDGQKYIVSGLLDVTPDVTHTDDEYQYIQGYGQVRTYQGGAYAGEDPDIKILDMSIQIPEMVNGEEKEVYDFWQGQLKVNELEDRPNVVEAAKEALINKVKEYYDKNPDSFLD